MYSIHAWSGQVLATCCILWLLACNVLHYSSYSHIIIYATNNTTVVLAWTMCACTCIDHVCASTSASTACKSFSVLHAVSLHTFKGSNFVDASLKECYKLKRSGQRLKLERVESKCLSLKDEATIRKSATKTLSKLHRYTTAPTALKKVLSESDKDEYGAGNQSFWKWTVSNPVLLLRLHGLYILTCGGSAWWYIHCMLYAFVSSTACMYMY